MTYAHAAMSFERSYIGMLEINHESELCTFIASSSRKWGSIMSFLDSHVHENEHMTYAHAAMSFERSYIGMLEINHESELCTFIASSSRKWGSIMSFLDSHVHANDNRTYAHDAMSFERGYHVHTEDLSCCRP